MFYTRASFVVLDYNSSGITSSGEPIISTLRLLWLGCSCYGSRGHKVSQWDSIRIQRQQYIVQSHLHFKHLSDTPPKTFLLSIYHSPYRLEKWLLNIWSLCSLKGKGGCAQVVFKVVTMDFIICCMLSILQTVIFLPIYDLIHSLCLNTHHLVKPMTKHVLVCTN